jgi:enamine deaminase RidA (YjgF/YER057c/UK114 family)
VIYLAGQVARETKHLGIAEQTAECLAGIDRLVAAAGAGRTRLLQATIFLADWADFPGMNAAWETWLAGAPPPGRATVKAELADPAWKVEIVAIAAV